MPNTTADAVKPFRLKVQPMVHVAEMAAGRDQAVGQGLTLERWV